MNNFCLGKNGRRSMRFFAFLLCFSLLFSNLAFGAYAAETEISAEAAGLAADDEANQSSLFEPLAENLLTPTQEDKGEKVKIIIELTDKPLLEYQSKMQSYATVSDFLESDEAQSIETKLQAARTKVEKALLRSDMDITVDREYSTVFNGISVDAYEGDLAAIQKIPGVKNAFVADFIGDSNIVDGVMHKDFLVSFSGVDFPCVDRGFAREQSVQVVVRPEDIEVVSPVEGQLVGVVNDVIFKGVHFEMHVECEGREWLIHSTRACTPGETIGMRIGPNEIHIMARSEG